MTPIRRHPLWLIAATGVVIRVVLAFAFFGNGDLFAFEQYARRASADPLHTYGLNASNLWWPYPPAYLLWLVAALKLAEGSGLPFHGVVQILPIAADLALAAAVYVYLGWRGVSERSRIAGFALVMLGPVFIAISGYHGQIDAVTILPGVVALMIWERGRSASRAVLAGLLIGFGAAIKTVPLLLAVPLLASARSLSERAKLALPAVAVPVLICLPFFAAEPDGFRVALEYGGVPGRGGLSLLADPTYAADRRTSLAVAFSGEPNGVASWLSDNSGPITLVAVLLLAVFLVRRRISPLQGIVLLWLTIFVFSPNFLLQYMVWALPFFIMAGYLWQVALLQLVMIPALVITYLSPSATTPTLAGIYVTMLICLWIAWVIALPLAVTRTRAGTPERAAAT